MLKSADMPACNASIEKAVIVHSVILSIDGLLRALVYYCREILGLCLEHPFAMDAGNKPVATCAHFNCLDLCRAHIASMLLVRIDGGRMATTTGRGRPDRRRG
jgi:hypothetical protein